VARRRPGERPRGPPSRVAAARSSNDGARRGAVRDRRRRRCRARRRRGPRRRRGARAACGAPGRPRRGAVRPRPVGAAGDGRGVRVGVRRRRAASAGTPRARTYNRLR
jgi:hypothetical protein